MFENCLAVPPERDPHRPWSSLRGCFSWRCSGHRGHHGRQHGMFNPFAKKGIEKISKTNNSQKIKANNWNQKSPTWYRQNRKKNRKQRWRFAVSQNVTLWFTESIYRPFPHLFFRNMWNLEKEKKVGFILLPSTEYTPNFDHHKSCACMETAICSPSFRVRTFSCGPWQTFKRAALLQLPIFCGSRWFQASWKYSILKIRNYVVSIGLSHPKKSLETPWPYLGSTGMNILSCFPTSCHSLEPQWMRYVFPKDVSSTCCLLGVLFLCFLNIESFIFVYFCCWVCFFFESMFPLKDLGYSTRRVHRRHISDTAKNRGFALQDGLMGRWHPNNVENLALPIMDFLHETGYGTISTPIQESRNSRNILGLLHTTGAIIWQSLHLWIPLIHIHNKNNTNSFTWETHFSINPPVWRPVFNRAQCQRKNGHHGIPFAPWAVWTTLLVPRSFESLSRWLISAKFNSDLEVFEQKLWASLG